MIRRQGAGIAPRAERVRGRDEGSDVGGMKAGLWLAELLQGEFDQRAQRRGLDIFQDGHAQVLECGGDGFEARVQGNASYAVRVQWSGEPRPEEVRMVCSWLVKRFVALGPSLWPPGSDGSDRARANGRVREEILADPTGLVLCGCYDTLR